MKAALGSKEKMGGAGRGVAYAQWQHKIVTARLFGDKAGLDEISHACAYAGILPGLPTCRQKLRSVTNEAQHEDVLDLSSTDLSAGGRNAT